MDIEVVKKEVFAKKALLIDVREADEWQAEHLKSAQWFPLSEIQKGIAPKLPKGQKIYLHCRSGKRSQTAAALLQALGFTDVTSVPMHFPDLVKAGL